MAEEEKLNLYQKLAKIRKIADVVQKSKRGYNYNYSDITEILAKVKGGEEEYGVSLIPSIVAGTAKTTPNSTTTPMFDKTGKSYQKVTNEMLFSADMVFRWVNNDNPEEFIDIPWAVTGSQSDPSQAMGSGLTYTMRQFLTNYFQIATTDDDPDTFRSKQKAAQESEKVSIASEIIEHLDGLIRIYLADKPDQKEDVLNFSKKYVRGGNYTKIKDPAVAAAMLEDFKKKYGVDDTEESKED